MERLIYNIKRWRDERVAIHRAQEDLAALKDEYEPKLKAVRRPPWDEYQYLLAEWHNEAIMLEDSIDEILSDQILRKATKLAVPLPAKPRRDETNDDWDLTCFHQHILTPSARMTLRREIATERKITREPIIAWLALAISFASLLLSAIANL